MDSVRVRAYPSPSDIASSSNQRHEDYSLEGIATNVKILLKLIEEHKEASHRGNDDQKLQRMTGMLGILEDLKSRIQKSQALGRRRAAELRRCNTDLKPRSSLKEKKANDAFVDEKERLKRGLNASLAARKSLEIMCSSLGKEKEIMALELAKKVHEVNELEELVNNLKTQNDSLSSKLQTYAAENKGVGGQDIQGNMTLQQRNKELTEQLLRSIDVYRSMKRRLKDTQEENARIRKTMEDFWGEVAAGLDHVCNLKQKVATGGEKPVDLGGDIAALEQKFESLKMKLS